MRKGELFTKLALGGKRIQSLKLLELFWSFHTRHSPRILKVTAVSSSPVPSYYGNGRWQVLFWALTSPSIFLKALKSLLLVPSGTCHWQGRLWGWQFAGCSIDIFKVWVGGLLLLLRLKSHIPALMPMWPGGITPAPPPRPSYNQLAWLAYYNLFSLPHPLFSTLSK